MMRFRPRRLASVMPMVIVDTGFARVPSPRSAPACTNTEYASCTRHDSALGALLSSQPPASPPSPPSTSAPPAEAPLLPAPPPLPPAPPAPLLPPAPPPPVLPPAPLRAPAPAAPLPPVAPLPLCPALPATDAPPLPPLPLPDTKLVPSHATAQNESATAPTPTLRRDHQL